MLSLLKVQESIEISKHGKKDKYNWLVDTSKCLTYVIIWKNCETTWVFIGVVCEEFL